MPDPTGNSPIVKPPEKPNVDDVKTPQNPKHNTVAGYIKDATNKTESISIWQRIKDFFYWMVGPISRAISSLFHFNKSETTKENSNERQNLRRSSSGSLSEGSSSRSSAGSSGGANVDPAGVQNAEPENKLNEGSQVTKNSSSDIPESLKDKLAGTFNAASGAKDSMPSGSSILPDDKLKTKNNTSEIVQQNDTNSPPIINANGLDGADNTNVNLESDISQPLSGASKIAIDSILSTAEDDEQANLVESQKHKHSVQTCFELPNKITPDEHSYVTVIDGIHDLYIEQFTNEQQNSEIHATKEQKIASELYLNQAHRLHKQARLSLIKLAKNNDVNNPAATVKEFTQFLAHFFSYLSFVDIQEHSGKLLDVSYNYDTDNKCFKVDVSINGTPINYYLKDFIFVENANQLQASSDFQEIQNHFIQINRHRYIENYPKLNVISDVTMTTMRKLTSYFESFKLEYIKNKEISNMLPVAFDGAYCNTTELLTKAIEQNGRIQEDAVGTDGIAKNFVEKKYYGGVANFVFCKILELAGVNKSDTDFHDMKDKELEQIYTNALTALKQQYTEDQISKLVGIQIAGNPGIPLGGLGLDIRVMFRDLDQILDSLYDMQSNYTENFTGDELHDYYGLTYDKLVANADLETEIDKIVTKIANLKPNATPQEKTQFIEEFKPVLTKYANVARERTTSLIGLLPKYIAGAGQEECVIANMMLSRLERAEIVAPVTDKQSTQDATALLTIPSLQATHTADSKSTENIRFTPLAMLKNMINSWGMYKPSGGTKDDRESLQGDIYQFAKDTRPYGLTYILPNQAQGPVRKRQQFIRNKNREVYGLFNKKFSFPCSTFFSFTANVNDDEKSGGQETGTRKKALSHAGLKDSDYHKDTIRQALTATVLSSIKMGNKHLGLAFGGTGINSKDADIKGHKYTSKNDYSKLVNQVLTEEYTIKGQTVKLAEFFNTVTLVDISN